MIFRIVYSFLVLFRLSHALPEQTTISPAALTKEMRVTQGLYEFRKFSDKRGHKTPTLWKKASPYDSKEIRRVTPEMDLVTKLKDMSFRPSIPRSILLIVSFTGNFKMESTNSTDCYQGPLIPYGLTEKV